MNNELGQNQIFHAESRYLKPALKAVERDSRTNAADLSRVEFVLRGIDAQSFDNLNVFRSEKYGIEIPFTHVSVRELTNTINADRDETRRSGQQRATEYEETIHEPETGDFVKTGEMVRIADQIAQKGRKVYVFFPGWGEPTVYDFQGKTYEIALGALPRMTASQELGIEDAEVDIYVMGQPTNLGGKVSEKWIQAVKEGGVTPLGEVYADLLRTHALTEPFNHLTFTGMSMGGSVTPHETAKQLNEFNDMKAQKQFDVETLYPAGIHEPFTSKVKTIAQLLKLGTGLYLVEGLGRSILDRTMKWERGLESAFRKDLAKLMVQKGISPNDSLRDQIQKTRVLLWEAWNLAKGTTRDPLIMDPEIIGKYDFTTAPLATYLGQLPELFSLIRRPGGLATKATTGKGIHVSHRRVGKGLFQATINESHYSNYNVHLMPKLVNWVRYAYGITDILGAKSHTK